MARVHYFDFTPDSKLSYQWIDQYEKKDLRHNEGLWKLVDSDKFYNGHMNGRLFAYTVHE